MIICGYKRVLTMKKLIQTMKYLKRAVQVGRCHRRLLLAAFILMPCQLKMILSDDPMLGNLNFKLILKGLI